MPDVNEKTYFLAWQGQAGTRQWFPVGRLDVDLAAPLFRFRHVQGATKAQATGGFMTVPGFADLGRDYRADRLFPVFQNRVMSPKRRDFADYLERLGLDPSVHPIETLSVDQGRRVTDFFEVFPKLTKEPDGSFVSRFFLHGWRRTNPAAEERMNGLAPGEKLQISLELTNPADGLAVQIQTADYHMIGWAPRYLVDDLVRAMAESPWDYQARVVRINPVPHPSSQRVLVELRSHWENHEPMSGEDFEPLV